MFPVLSQICSLHSAFDDDIREYAAGHCNGVDVWLTKLESYLVGHTVDDVRRLMDENEMTMPAASFQGGILASQGEMRRETWAMFVRRIELCKQLGIKALVVACDVPKPFGQQDLERVHLSLLQASQEAERCEVRIALEFQAQSAFGNNLQTAAAMVAEVNSPCIGLCLDAFHYFVGPSKPDDLNLLTRDNLFHVQLCDLADVPREIAVDADRVLPGDGDIPLEPIINRLRDIQYSGPVSVELLNPKLWQVAPRQFGEIAITSLRKILGLAAMD